MGNLYLKWAFVEAACLAKRSHPAFAKLARRLEKNKGRQEARQRIDSSRNPPRS